MDAGQHRTAPPEIRTTEFGLERAQDIPRHCHRRKEPVPTARAGERGIGTGLYVDELRLAGNARYLDRGDAREQIAHILDPRHHVSDASEFLWKPGLLPI